MKKLLAAAAAFVLTFVLIEGSSSVVLLVHDLLFKSRPALAERAHTRYDEDLGWVSLPNVSIPDLYGPGIHFRTNAQGFRNDEDITPQSPPHKLRAICSGDSFTLGYGVDNDHTWCRLLTSIDRRLETVNMGQGGYGIDQAFLWYRRDGMPLEHEIHLFAFVTADFNRMQRDTFLGYGKPVLTIKDGQLITENVPVPRRAFRLSWLISNAPLFLELRSIKLGNAVLERIIGRSRESRKPTEESRQIVLKVLETIEEINRRKQSVLITVFLPTEGDYEGVELTEEWRQILRNETEKRKIHFVDLVEDFRSIPKDVRKLFIPKGALKFGDAAGHYTIEGNEMVAKALYSRLVALPEISSKLSALR